MFWRVCFYLNVVYAHHVQYYFVLCCQLNKIRFDFALSKKDLQEIIMSRD
jgi:hypothetical protein